ncbi:CIC11C00000003128 [Sungouiella intermedia]|uniref:CIC11C00000000134 n=1 Tax=Sungouiella intermedia TaxID=45354 RepID=A0A1L0D5B8_9ASCO|nr:CIC11C00000003128 [[Candida] intermedia]SGZ50110.1 CIC11C00000000134 [[Candida] intermedia]
MFQLATQTSRQALRSAVRSYSTVTAAPKKVGAFRGGLVGFLLGVTVTGGASYYYLLDEYTKANNALLVDLFSLKETVENLETHVKKLESQK